MNTAAKIQQYADRLCYKSFDSHQVRAIESVCIGKDTLVVSTPGFIKKIIILAAAMSNEKRPVLVIEPALPQINEQMWDLLLRDESIAAASLTEYNREDHDELLKKFKKAKSVSST